MSDDMYFNEAVEKTKKLMVDAGKYSTSFVQRAMQIGYRDAVDIVLELEKQDFITKPDVLGQRKLKDKTNDK